jgi:aspartokinase
MLNPPRHGVVYAPTFQLKPAQQLGGYRVSVFDSPEALLDLGCKLHSASNHITRCVDQSVGLLATAGEAMRRTPGLAGRLFTAIFREKINIIAIAQGSSELAIAIVVKRDMLEKAVRAIHAESRLGERQPQPALS